MLVSVAWAKDQSGCSDKKDVDMGNNCRRSMDIIGLACGTDPSHGGGYIEDVGAGCLEWLIGKDTTYTG